jgi:cobalt-zinc-cadmium efflux system membrane fusion protein
MLHWAFPARRGIMGARRFACRWNAYMSAVRSLACLAFVALAAAGCGEKKANAVQETPAGPSLKTVKFDPKALATLGIKVDVAGNSAAEYDLDVPGTVEYNLDRYAEIGTMVDGRIVQMRVKVGDTVKAGQQLATLVVPSIANAQADFISAEATAKVARENETREEALLKRELTTAREAEQARAEAQKTQAELAATKARLQALGVSMPVGGSGAIHGAGTLQLTTPIDGVVVRRDAVLGRFIQAKETAFVVADPLHLRAVLSVYEADLPYFRVGADARITVDAMPGKAFQGKIVVLEPQVGRASRAARAYIDLDNADGYLKPGLFVRANIRLPEEAASGRLLVPAPAVQPIGDDDVVFVEMGPGQFEVRKIALARRTPQIAEIREGVKRGERIVVEGAFILRGEVTKQ